MKNIYKITKSQLITLLIFLTVTFFILIKGAHPSYYCYIIDFGSRCHWFRSFLLILIPFVAIFYTIGWLNSNKKITEEKKSVTSKSEINNNDFLKEVQKPNLLSMFIITGIIWSLAQRFNKDLYDQVIILVVAGTCGYLYDKFNNKLKIRNKLLRNIVAFLIVYLIAASVIGFLTALI